jgi:hypothetical protein
VVVIECGAEPHEDLDPELCLSKLRARIGIIV